MPKKILAVDDERHIVRLVQVNLERTGYEVVTAYDGKQALEQIEAEKPDLVVLDVMMPHMDGFEVLEILRKNPATQDLPVIMLVAKAPDQDVFRGWQTGVDCYLTKPFNPMELISFVKRIFASRDGSETDEDRANGSEANTASRPPFSAHPAQAAAAPASTKPTSFWSKLEQVWRKIGF